MQSLLTNVTPRYVRLFVLGYFVWRNDGTANADRRPTTPKDTSSLGRWDDGMS